MRSIEPQRLLVLVALAVIVAVGFLLRAPGVDWLVGAGLNPEFTFHPDDQRFLKGARNFAEPWPDGYVVGMTAQVYAVLSTAELFGPVNGLRAMRYIVLTYALLTLVLVYFVARRVGIGRLGSTAASGLLCLSPIHVVNSAFGTADMPVVAFFYLSFLCLCAFVRDQREGPFIACMVLVGGCLALKFFLPALVLAAGAILLSPQRKLWARYVSSALYVLSGFFIFSLFNYTIWEFAPFVRMLLFDNLVVPGGHGPVWQALRYGGDMVPALGIPSFALFAVGLLMMGRAVFKRHEAIRTLLTSREPTDSAGSTLQVRCAFVLAMALLSHSALLVSAGIHGARQVLVLIPAACLLGGFAIESILAQGKLRVASRFVLPVAFFYLAINANATKEMFSTDMRRELAVWVDSVSKGGARVATMGQMPYAQVAGSTPVDDHHQARQSSYFLTCDIEYRRYFRGGEAEDIHHSWGQERVDFFRNLFSGLERFELVKVFKQKPTSIETRMIENRWLPPIGMFIPRTCLAFERVAAPPGRSSAELLDATDRRRNHW